MSINEETYKIRLDVFFIFEYSVFRYFRYENSILVRLLFRVVEIQRISEATATP